MRRYQENKYCGPGSFDDLIGMEEEDESKAAPASLIDSRRQQASVENTQESARYLSRNPDSSNSFSQAFAALRQTESYQSEPIAAPANDANPPSSSSGATIFANRVQTGNPVLRSVKNVQVQFRDNLIPDYVMGDGSQTCCVLFLSVRYHLLHTDYLQQRIDRILKEDQTTYRTRVVLCFVDVDDNEGPLQEINRVALLNRFTLLLSWTWLEAARYLETLKVYEHKPATLIKEKVDNEFLPTANDVLTTVRSVNKTDVVTLLSTFNNVQGVMNASMEELSLCPGIGVRKVQDLLHTFHEPFSK